MQTNNCVLHYLKRMHIYLPNAHCHNNSSISLASTVSRNVERALMEHHAHRVLMANSCLLTSVLQLVLQKHSPIPLPTHAIHVKQHAVVVHLSPIALTVILDII